MTTDRKCFHPLAIGQRIRVTRRKMEHGVPMRDARMVVDSVTEGVITALLRVKESPNTVRMSYTDGNVTSTAHADIRIIGGLHLNDYNRGQAIEILANPSEQGFLFDRRAA